MTHEEENTRRAAPIMEMAHNAALETLSSIGIHTMEDHSFLIGKFENYFLEPIDRKRIPYMIPNVTVRADTFEGQTTGKRETFPKLEGE